MQILPSAAALEGPTPHQRTQPFGTQECSHATDGRIHGTSHDTYSCIVNGMDNVTINVCIVNVGRCLHVYLSIVLHFPVYFNGMVCIFNGMVCIFLYISMVWYAFSMAPSGTKLSRNIYQLKYRDTYPCFGNNMVNVKLNLYIL